jgi:hypothetical protein
VYTAAISILIDPSRDDEAQSNHGNAENTEDPEISAENLSESDECEKKQG